MYLYNLFLDDEREPPWHTEFEVVRTYADFLWFIQNFGSPKILSLDHDLGEEKTGLDCLRWLINEHLDGHVDLSGMELRVHSMNPIGAENIRRLWEGFSGSVM